MASKKVPGFPEVSNKLQAPTKKSLFERQKADAEAKRQREAAETAAVYQDFVKSFDDDENELDHLASTRRDENRGGFGGGRHFGRGGIPTGPASGGGALGGRGAFGSGPGSLGPPPTFNTGRKRNFEGFTPTGFKRDTEERGLLAFEDYEDSTLSNVLRTSDDDDEKVAKDREEEKAVAKPTLRLASLPPGTSPAVIKALIPTNLVVENVRILPPPGPGQTTERKSMSAIITLATDTAANDIDTAVSSLQNKYLGFGYYLNLHRHLSSAAISSTTAMTSLSTATVTQPFGAKPVALPSAGRGMPHPHPRGFAPPTSYGPPIAQSIRSNTPLLHVPVQPPNDIKQLRLIHKTLESLLNHGPEFEALLMSRPNVQREEKWSFLFDARSTEGVYYRYRLWEILTGMQSQRGKGRYLPLFEGASAWKQPDEPLNFEYVTKLEEFVSDEEYISSDDEDSETEGRTRPTEAGGLQEESKTYLSPLHKAKLVHLLARLPSSTSRLRKGDVARITCFAISHASQGADEVVMAIIDNLFHPFCYSSANPSYVNPHQRRKPSDTSKADQDQVEPQQSETTTEEGDHSQCSMLALHLISSILSSSSTSGMRHAWRYRQLFEASLLSRKVFEYLGGWEKRGKWGRLRAEKWKRQVAQVLSLWEGWCALSAEGMENLRAGFERPLKGDGEDERDGRGGEADRTRIDLGRSKEEDEEAKKGKRWKAVEAEAVPRDVSHHVDRSVDENVVDIDGQPMNQDGDDDDVDLDGVPMDDNDDDLDGEPMDEDEDEDMGEGMDMDMDKNETENVQEGRSRDEHKITSAEAHEGPSAKQRDSNKEQDKNRALPGNLAPGRRLRAVDMFADSDEE